LKRNLLYPLLFAVLCGVCAYLIGVKVISLSIIEISLLATTLYFCCLFLRELRLSDFFYEGHLSETLQTKQQAILDKLTQMDEHRQALSKEIDSKIARIINKNIEKLELEDGSIDSPARVDLLDSDNRFSNVISQRFGVQTEQPEISLELSNDEGTVGDSPSIKMAQPGDRGVKKSHQSFISRDILLDTIRDALKTDSIETLLQPIVSLPQRRKRFFEATSRLRGANRLIIRPEEYILLAEEHSLIRIIDNAILMKCIYLARSSSKMDLNVGFFLNLSHKTLEDSEFIDSLGEFIEINQNIVDRFIFCLEADDMKNSSAERLRTIKGLGGLGCQFALTHVNSFDFDFAMLRDYKIQFLKIHHEVLKTYLSENSVEHVKLFKHQAYMHQIDLVVTHVETEDQLKSILDFESDFAQGYLFARPQVMESVDRSDGISNA
jgi:EAL domain-containing protein (putative c-di-GMP-specific phosphodiesterase class I)